MWSKRIIYIHSNIVVCGTVYHKQIEFFFLKMENFICDIIFGDLCKYKEYNKVCKSHLRVYIFKMHLHYYRFI